MFSSPSSISGNDAEASDLGEPSLRGKANELSLSEVAISSTGQTIHLSFHRLDPMHCHLQTQILPFPGPERDTNSPKQSILRTDSSSFADTEPDRSNEEGELPTKLVIPHPGIESEECSKLPLTPHWILKLQGIDRIN